MTNAHDGEAELLRHGMALLDAQREAMIAGKPDELATANAALADWLARMPRAGAAAGGMPGARADTTRMLVALRANAAVAQRAASAAQRGITALLAPPDPVYDADGWKSAASRRSKSLSA